MKKLILGVVAFGMISTSSAFAALVPANGLSLALGEKSAGQMNARMLACGRPARMKRPESASSAERVADSRSGAPTAISAK